MLETRDWALITEKKFIRVLNVFQYGTAVGNPTQIRGEAHKYAAKRKSTRRSAQVRGEAHKTFTFSKSVSQK